MEAGERVPLLPCQDVIKEREPHITVIVHAAIEHACAAEAQMMFGTKCAAWKLPPPSPYSAHDPRMT
jgi:hypothetical protein